MASDRPTIAEPGRAPPEGGAHADRPATTPNPPAATQDPVTGWNPLGDRELPPPPDPAEEGAPTLPPDDAAGREPSAVPPDPSPGQSQITDEVMALERGSK